MNDMDAFKELAARMPDMELMTIEQTHGIVFWAGAGAKWARLQIDMAKQVGGMQKQIDAWIRDGQMVGDLEMRGQQRLGKIARDTDQVQAPGAGRGKKPGTEPPKWQRLGFKSKAAMEQAEFLEAHPEEVDEVIKEAKQDEDLPSKGAVKSKVRAKHEKQLREKYQKETKAKKADSAARTTGEALIYLGKLREIVLLLPVKIPPEGWTDESFAEANAMVEIIRKRLEAWA